MKIALVPFGSRGDIQPFLALGTALRRRGHKVDLVTSGDFQKLADDADLNLKEIPTSTGNFFEIPEVIESLRKSPSALRMERRLPGTSPEAYASLLERIDAMCADADFTVNALFTKGISVARSDRPWCASSWWPITPTGAFPAFGAPELPLGPLYNRLTHLVAGQVEWWKTRRMVNGFRAKRGLPTIGARSPYRELGRDLPMMYPYSSSLIPRPADWPGHCHVTGYWFWERSWQPPAELEEFLASEPKPLVATFGSTWPVHREELTRAALRAAAERTGRRIVVVGGRPEPLRDGDFHLTEADYSWLFPRASAVIHNCGYGTTAEVLKAGVPQVVIPTFADHPFWASKVRKLGVAAKPIRFASMRVEEVVAGVEEAVGSAAMAEQAARIGERVRAERGVERACDIIEGWYERNLVHG
ncbi:glycosyltransferase [Amycolatopsis cihanbeyliensis]|uniref:glycosyltransferase n=1 Tax=Amycolatopsis cihanbeyliensis TaxID=1128664 RepID=UPI001476E319|nr:glycosyltransferase [Amycolatopsis cihanbeyliensis]